MQAIAVIGLGNIGFRHLQALAQITSVKHISVIDCDEKALAKINSLVSGAVFEKFSSIREFTKNARPFDLVVSALRADIQQASFRQILALRAHTFLFEKPFAQSKSQYSEMILLAENAKCFVNCQRNSWAGYHRIKEALSLAGCSDAIHIEVSGNRWGIGCNSVHFIEVFRFITQARSIQCVSSQLEKVENKRGEHYEEFIGTMGFRSDKVHTLQVTSGNSNQNPGNVFLTVYKSGIPVYFVDDEAGSVVNLTAGNQAIYPPAIVSRTTKEFTMSLVADESVFHPTLQEAKISHFALYDALEKSFDRSEFSIT